MLCEFSVSFYRHRSFNSGVQVDVPTGSLLRGFVRKCYQWCFPRECACEAPCHPRWCSSLSWSVLPFVSCWTRGRRSSLQSTLGAGTSSSCSFSTEQCLSVLVSLQFLNFSFFLLSACCEFLSTCFIVFVVLCALCCFVSFHGVQWLSRVLAFNDVRFGLRLERLQAQRRLHVNVMFVLVETLVCVNVR